MELELTRLYFNTGTNGSFFYNGRIIAYSIELPWKDNHARVSCIPEGRYELVKRYSPHFNWHLEVLNVPSRSLILVHPANDALLELKGCIAPVSFLTGAGKGGQSVQALKIVTGLVYASFALHEKVFLNIKS